MAIQKVSEIEGEPEVGQFYLVPCVSRVKGEFWAINGPRHDDKEYIGVALEHWHFDFRFLTDAQARSLIRLTPLRSLEGAMAFVAGEADLQAPVLRRLKCRRRMPTFPGVAFWLSALEDAYKGARLKSCRTCPHRGLPLGNLPKDEQGNVVCSGHGLKWNLEDGTLVIRP